MRKTISSIMLFLLVTSTLALAVRVQPVKADGPQAVSWDFYNDMTFYTNDVATKGAPSYVQIISLEIRQIGQYVQFVWEGNGSLYDIPSMQYYVIVFDTDLNPNTGQVWGKGGYAGAEFIIGVSHVATLTYFDTGGFLIKELTDMPVVFEGHKFYLNIEKDEIPSDTFNLWFECSGAEPYRCDGSLNRVTLQPSRPELKMLIDSDNTVLAEKPALINIRYKNTSVQLRTYLISGENKTELPNDELVYTVSHPVSKPALGDPSSIISVDANGTATYLREGFVFVTSYSKESHFSSEPVILATGKVYGNPETDNVLAVFPEDYRPIGTYSFGDMMKNYPTYIKTVSSAYDVERELYDGYVPFNGNKQIFALLVFQVGEAAGGADNPLETGPGGYMNYGNGEPQYNVVIHEMGHNFAGTIGMYGELTVADGGIIGRSGFNEAVASLPVIYFANELYDYPEKYGFTKDSFEGQYYRDFVQGDAPSSEQYLVNFENMISEGKIKGIFDNNGTFDGVAVFCSLFQQYVYGYANDTDPYKQDVIKRFLGLFPNEELPDFEQDKVETYFAASFSAAVGHDIREKLKFWGFSIDDAYYDEIYPELKARADAISENTEFYVMVDGVDHTVAANTDSTITGFAFDQENKQASFNITGAGNRGYFNVTIPSDLLSGECSVFEDGKNIIKDSDYTQTYNGTDNIFSFTINQSSHTLVIKFAYVAGTHDIAVTNIAPSKTVIGLGYSEMVNITSANTGDFAELLNVTLSANTTVVNEFTDEPLVAGGTITVPLELNTSGLDYGNYTIHAYATPVPGQTDTLNNNFTLGTVKITIPGDINGDFKVGLPDLVILAKAYASKPVDLYWNANADIDGNNAVGLSDLVILAQHYGQHHP